MGKSRDRRERRRNKYSLKKAFVPWVMAVLFIALAMFAGHVLPVFTEAYADNTKCEDGKECFMAYHKDHEKKDQCRATENKQWIFYDPPQPCGDEPPKEPQYTNTPKQQQATKTQVPKEPTVTNEPVQPTATEKPEEKQPTATTKAQVSPTATGYIDPTKEEDEKNPTATLRPDDPDRGGNNNPTTTATIATIAVQQEDDCEWCMMARWFLSLFERLVVAEEQETNYIATQVSK